jgi:hypothetical protein
VSTTPRRAAREWALELGLPLALWLVAIALVRPLADVPTIDEWLYAKQAAATAAAGAPARGPTWQGPWALPQALYGAGLMRVFGPAYAPLRLTNLGLAILAAVGLYAFLRRAAGSGTARAAGVAAFLACAWTVILAPSFMTDLPFLCGWIWACWLFERAIERESVPLLAAAGALTAVTVLERQIGVFIALAGLLVWAGRARAGRAGERFSILLLLASLSGLAVAWLGQRWWGAIPPSATLWNLRPGRSLASAVLLLMNVGLAAAPLVPIARIPAVFTERPGRGARILGLGFLLLAGSAVYAGLEGRLSPVAPHLLSPFGLMLEGGLFAGARDEIFGPGLRSGLTAMAAIGLAALVAALGAFAARFLAPPAPPDGVAPERPRAGAILVPAGFLCVVGTAFLADTVFDRYCLPAVPAAILILVERARPGRAAAAATGGLILAAAAFSWTLSADHRRCDEAGAEAAAWAVAQGIEPRAVEGGYDWDGTHRAIAPGNVRIVLMKRPLIAWWESLFEETEPLAVVAFSEMPGFETWRTFEYESIWPPHRRRIYLLRPAGPR